MPNRTAMPLVTRPTGDRDRAYRFSVIACYSLGVTERQRTALVDGAALMLAAGAPASAGHLLAAAGIPQHLVRCLTRLLNGFDPAQWVVQRAETPCGIPVIQDLDRTITVPAWLDYDGALDGITLRMEETSRHEVRHILGRRRDWTVAERSSRAPNLDGADQRSLAARVDRGARLADLVPA